MKLEDQVVSLGLAKELKELGVGQKSYFSWWKECNGEVFCGDDLVLEEGWKELDRVCSAFTVAELGEVINNNGYTIRVGNKWTTIFNDKSNATNVTKQLNFFEDTEADARAKLLIYLIKENIITNKE